jgi:hypothetical protein
LFFFEQEETIHAFVTLSPTLFSPSSPPHIIICWAELITHSLYET